MADRDIHSTFRNNFKFHVTVFEVTATATVTAAQYASLSFLNILSFR